MKRMILEKFKEIELSKEADFQIYVVLLNL